MDDQTLLDCTESGHDPATPPAEVQGIDFQALKALKEKYGLQITIRSDSAAIDAMLTTPQGDGANMTLYDKSSYNKYDKVNLVEPPPPDEVGHQEYKELMRKYFQDQAQGSRQ